MTARYDLQVHTDASPCSGTSPERVVRAALGADLDGIAVTDHDTVANVDRVEALAPPELTVVPGVEVTTTQGHLLALDVGDPPPQVDPLSVVDEIHDRGGLAVLSHPFDSLRQRYDVELAALADAVDAVEAVNSRCVRAAYNERARRFAATHDLAVTGGSDAHFPMEVGRAYTTFDPDVGLRAALRRRETDGRGRGRYLSGHVATKVQQAVSLLEGR